MDGVVPIRRVIRSQRILSFLESQFCKDYELGVELVETTPDSLTTSEVFRLYTRRKKEDWDRDRFVIRRKRIQGRIREYRIEGDIYFEM